MDKMTKCCCEHGDNGNSSNSNDNALDAIIATHRSGKGALIPVLHETQELFGYIPEHAQKRIAEALNIPISEVFGVISFYSHFSTVPKGKFNISVCIGTACYVKGAGEILERFKERLSIKEGQCTPDNRFSLEACRCLGACGLAPVLTVNGKVFGSLTLNDVDKIIDRYRKISDN